MAVATEVRAPEGPPPDDPTEPPTAPQGRMRRWVRAPLDAPLESWIGAAVAFLCCTFVLFQLHPDLILAKTTPAGGDMGAHVWGPAYIRDHLLPAGRLTGWTPDWYAGFPAFQFYMLPPALAIVLLNVVLPYGIAFKLVTVSGVVLMPLCAYAMGRLLRLPFPGPPLLAIATLPYLFDRTWTIYGGNVASTLAGEYSFSISLSLALLFFGFFGRGLEDGRHRALSAVLLSLVILCHAIPAFFALAGAAILLLMRFDRKRLRFAIPTLAVGGLLTAFWSVPFILERKLLTDMGWERLEAYKASLLPDGTRWVVVLALVGVVLSLVFWIRLGAFFTLLGVLCAGGFVINVLEPVNIWNARLLPFYYLATYLMAAIGVSEVLRSLAVIVDARVEWRRRAAETAGMVVAFGLCLVVVALPLRNLPGGKVESDGKYHWLFLETTDDSFVDSWASWNYEGYERKAAYPEYRSIISTMERIGKTEGCGRANWEYESDLNRYGTPMAMMLLPFWTDGCIGSMEGLYFESSGTTPFHFLNSAELSKAPSNPVRDEPDRPMPYSGLNVDQGVRHLQMFGVKYYLAFSPEAIEQADRNPDLTKIATSPPWTVYEVADSEPVEALRYQPAVLKGMSEDNPAWQRDAVAWYTNPDDLDVVLAPDGPKAWQRIDRGEDPDKTALPPVEVSNIREGDLSVSFDVDRTGVPILVKTSYFPNWKVKGADRIYHVTPNLMVVVPTAKHVRLGYGYTGADALGYGLTAVALLGLVYLAWRGRVDLPEPLPVPAGAGAGPDGDGTLDADGTWTPGTRPGEGGDRGDGADGARAGDGDADADDETAEPREPVGFWDALLAEQRAARGGEASPPTTRPHAGGGDDGPADDGSGDDGDDPATDDPTRGDPAR